MEEIKNIKDNYTINKDSAPFVFLTDSPEQTEAVGAALARAVKGELAFIALDGELGAGKTAFTRGLASVLSPGSAVKSPTYTIVNEYNNGALPFYHFDLYRISDADDLYSTGYYDYLDLGICAVEWSCRADTELPLPRWHIKIEQKSENTRQITVEYMNNGVI